MEKRMKQMLEADVQIQGGRAVWNNAGRKGTLDGPEKKEKKKLSNGLSGERSGERLLCEDDEGLTT